MVHGAYQLLTSWEASQGDQVADLIWHKQVLLKAFIFAWRLLQNWLPTRSNLLDRGIISYVDARCLAGCAHMETSQHLFLSCDFYGLLWHAVRSWLGVSGPDPFSISGLKPIVSVYLLRVWFARTAFFHAASLVTLCLDYME